MTDEQRRVVEWAASQGHEIDEHSADDILRARRALAMPGLTEVQQKAAERVLETFGNTFAVFDLPEDVWQR